LIEKNKKKIVKNESAFEKAKRKLRKITLKEEEKKISSSKLSFFHFDNKCK
jgi:hypothetical protein